MTAKRGRGRPKLHTEAVERSQVSVPVSVSEKLREVGDGSLSAGIVAASYRVPDKPKPPKSRYTVVTDEAEIEAIKRAGLADPIGGVIDGQWFAEAQSLAQFRGGTKYKVKA
jgi:hypothetical protein